MEVPVFAPDGQLHSSPGYREASRAYYHPATGLVVPEVPIVPRVEDVARAKALLLDELLGEFPFVSQADRAQAMALGLLPYVRDLIGGPTPNHLIEAPVAGSGKGLLAQALLLPGVGIHLGIVSQVTEDEEWRKLITARLKEGRPVILIDNVTRPLESGVLASALTATTWEDRILGKSENVSLPVRCVFVTTANNPVLSTEIARRSVRIRLDPRVDRPWQREGFKHPDLRQWAEEHRGELVWAGLVLVRSWLAAGRPRPAIKPLGSYEDWSLVVGGVLEVAGIADFLGNLEELYEASDLEGGCWRQLVGAWWEEYTGREVKASDLFELAQGVEGLDFGGGSDRARRTSFGMQLRKQRDRVIGEYRILAAGKEQRASKWKLELAHGSLFDERKGEPR